MFKKLVFSSLILFGLLMLSPQALAQSADPTTDSLTPISDISEIDQNSEVVDQQLASIYFFFSDTCPHCTEEKIFLGYLQHKYPNLGIYGFDIADQSSVEILKNVGQELDFELRGVPVTIVGQEVIIGYGSHQTQGKQIEELITSCSSAEPCLDSVAPLLNDQQLTKAESVIETKLEEKADQIIELAEERGLVVEIEDESSTSVNDNTKLSLPIVGEIDYGQMSLPILTVTLGVLDGFNPCAMWALLFLISLLLGMEDRRRMWLLGTVFILTSGLVYFLFMAAWLNFFLFIGYVVWVRLAIALLALGAGAYHLKDWYDNRGTCKVEGNQNRLAIFEKLKDITKKQQLILALAGIIALAFAVNLVELICSAGLPAIYTQVLSLNDLPGWQYYGYLLTYIFFFMLDDLFVFVVAMVTLRAAGINGKYGQYSKVIGGILMLIIGLLLAFRPEWLMFG